MEGCRSRKKKTKCALHFRYRLIVPNFQTRSIFGSREHQWERSTKKLLCQAMWQIADIYISDTDSVKCLKVTSHYYSLYTCLFLYLCLSSHSHSHLDIHTIASTHTHPHTHSNSSKLLFAIVLDHTQTHTCIHTHWVWQIMTQHPVAIMHTHIYICA